MSFLLKARVKCTVLYTVRTLHRCKPQRCLSTCENDLKKEEEGTRQLKSTYQHSEVEANWYEFWESRNYFKPTKSEADSFVVLLPPPNITGTLHLGHALTCTIQDILVRWKRMKGESVLWVPGIDHAGIATQAAVEKNLAKSGLSRHDLGREEFVKVIWDWKNEKAPRITEQLRKMGASLDWSKFIFTLDSSHSDLVKNSFIKLYNDGLIYRKGSLVNWSCALKSSISDIEVEWMTIHKKKELNVPGYEKPVTFGLLYDFAYKLCDEDDEIVVSTTRPETMLGDTAVAIHPDHPSVSKFANKYVWHPFRNEKIPIIVDDVVNPTFGTGAVKITPSGSPIDFEVGLRHRLKSIPVVSEEGFINKIGPEGKFHGLKRFDARWAVIKGLKDLNLFRSSKSHSMSLPVCSRSGDPIEYVLKEQWFLKLGSLVEKARDALESGEMEITPKSFRSVWLDWLSSKKTTDWNLSRQLWWGHQIPMYECQYEGKSEWVAGLSLDEAKSKGAEMFGAAPEAVKVVQDPDVLDTWFSSGLLSLSGMIDQRRSPPISLMVTGHDILFFWVMRMVMLSVQLTGQLPFKNVFLHGLVCDAAGKKMSKSVGNVIDPEDIINGVSKSELEARLQSSLQEGLMTKESFKEALASQNALFPKGIPDCGVDALRLTLCSKGVQGTSTKFDVHSCLTTKFFCNKVYQGFVYFSKIADAYKEKRGEFDLADVKAERATLNQFDLWILSRLDEVVQFVDTSVASYGFEVAVREIRSFITDEFCNFYLESTKPVLENASPTQFRTTISVFFHCFETFLRLLSPFAPYLSEHLYQALPLLNGYDRWESVTIAKYPTVGDWSEFRNPELGDRFRKLADFVSAMRRVKDMFSLKAERPNVCVKCPDDVAEVVFSEVQYVFCRLGRVGSLTRVDSPQKNAIREDVDENFTVYVEHNYDKAAVLNLVGPIMKKEDGLKQSLAKALNTVNGPRYGNMSVSEKRKLAKKVDDLNLDLKKIEACKYAVDNCER